MKFKILVFLGICIWTLGVYAQNEPAPFPKDSLTDYMKAQQEKWKIPALAVAVIKDGEVVQQFVNGVTDVNSQTPIDEHSLFMIGSNTKAFTAILMAMLEQEKALSLKDPVVKWLPYFKLYDPWLTDHIDVIDVLSHRVGFQTFQGDFLNFDNELTSEEIIRKFALIEPTHQYRETWGYFNTGYTIAGEIVKKATGKSWAEQIEAKIFEPIGMRHSLALSEEIVNAQNKTYAHTIIDGTPVQIPYGDIDATAPAGSIASSITDMSAWVKTLLNNGKYDRKQVIPLNAINTTIFPRTVMGEGSHPFNRSQFSLYGMGWDLQDYEGYKLIMHTGGIHGYVTSVTTLPEKNLGIVILTNTDSNYLFESLKWDILDAYLELPHRALSDLYHSYFERNEYGEKQQKEAWEKEIANGNTPSAPLTAFEGMYRNEVYGWLKIKKEGDRLHIDFEHHKDLKVQLAHLKNDEFLASYSNVLYGESVFPFEIIDGQVKKFTLKLHPQVEQTTYDFYKQ